MVFNISEFKAQLSGSGDLASPNQFIVMITPPSGLISQNNTMSVERLAFFCSSSNLPGVSLATDEIRHNGYGVVEKRPYNVLFEDLQCVFFADAQGKVYRYFHDWLLFINNFDINNSGSITNGNVRDTFSYPSEYFTTINIIQFNSIGDQILKYTLHNAYPVTLGSTEVAWESINQFVRLPITFTYHSWSSETYDTGSFSESGLDVQGLLSPYVPYVDITNLRQLSNFVFNNSSSENIDSILSVLRTSVSPSQRQI